MRGARTLLLGIACLLAAAQPAAARSPADVSLSRSAVATRIGDSFRFTSEVENRSGAALTGMVAHLNVVGLSAGTYVDPEDWSEQRTKSLPPLRPGESTSVSWKVKAVTGGRAAIYVVVLPDRGPLAVSPAIAVRITDTKDFNSGGVLPLALGVPALLAGAAAAARRRRTR